MKMKRIASLLLALMLLMTQGLALAVDPAELAWDITLDLLAVYEQGNAQLHNMEIAWRDDNDRDDVPRQDTAALTLMLSRARENLMMLLDAAPDDAATEALLDAYQDANWLVHVVQNPDLDLNGFAEKADALSRSMVAFRAESDLLLHGVSQQQRDAVAQSRCMDYFTRAKALEDKLDMAGALALYRVSDVPEARAHVQELAALSDIEGIYMVGKGLIAAMRDDRWGVIDETGKVLVPFIYNNISPMREGLMRVYNSGKYGFVDAAGKVVIKLEHSWAEDFCNGYARIRTGSYSSYRYGAINKAGEVVVQAQYDEMTDFNAHGLAIVTETAGTYSRNDDTCGVVNASGELIIPMAYGNSTITLLDNGMVQITDKGEKTYSYDDTYALYGADGTLLAGPGAKSVTLLTEGMVRVRIDQQDIYLDAQGNPTAAPVTAASTPVPEDAAFSAYDDVRRQGDDLAVVCIVTETEDGRSWRYGLADGQGRLLTDCEYTGVGDFVEDVAFASKEVLVDGEVRELIGLIDRWGMTIAPFEYGSEDNRYMRDVFRFVDGYAVVLKDVGEAVHAGVMDTRGRLVLPLTERPCQVMAGGMALVGNEAAQKMGVVSLRDGRQVLPAIYSGIDQPESYRYSGWDYYDRVTIPWPEGYYRLAVREGEDKARFGVADAWGQLVIPVEYDEIITAGSGMWYVRQGDHYGVINLAGEVIIHCLYETVYGGGLNELLGFAGYRDDLGYHYALTDMNGEMLSGLIYSDLYEVFADKDDPATKTGFIMPEMEDAEGNNTYGLISPRGEEILPCVYGDAQIAVSEDRIFVLQSGFMLMLDHNGQRALPQGE